MALHIQKTSLLCIKPRGGSEISPQLKAQARDNVLSGQDYRTPQGVVINEYEAMVEWLLAGENPRNSDRNLLRTYTTNLIWSRPGLSPSLRGKKSSFIEERNLLLQSQSQYIESDVFSCIS
jgi:hypothetical protein